MWRNPKYFPPKLIALTAIPPEEQGERLATFPRGEGVELRLCRSEFNGRPFLSLRQWERNRDGAWWPIRGKGCSIRLSEVAELAKVLAALSPV